ncbi:aurora kinase [Kipferlia bialata]|uniref:Aurora kinase n=1 Tax=Kipferlia bialata TaxID=797122 RepID=A0A9K3CY40_9EUKA|nr:aurora kinase [Kipferlia bialata]|eukprot:g5150.t1
MAMHQREKEREREMAALTASVAELHKPKPKAKTLKRSVSAMNIDDLPRSTPKPGISSGYATVSHPSKRKPVPVAPPMTTAERQKQVEQNRKLREGKQALIQLNRTQSRPVGAVPGKTKSKPHPEPERDTGSDGDTTMVMSARNLGTLRGTYNARPVVSPTSSTANSMWTASSVMSSPSRRVSDVSVRAPVSPMVSEEDRQARIKALNARIQDRQARIKDDAVHALNAQMLSMEDGGVNRRTDSYPVADFARSPDLSINKRLRPSEIFRTLSAGQIHTRMVHMLPKLGDVSGKAKRQSANWSRDGVARREVVEWEHQQGLSEQALRDKEKEREKERRRQGLPAREREDKPKAPTVARDRWTLADFELGKLLGKGKYGRVFMARERQTNYIVALKVLDAATIQEERVERQILREVTIQTNLCSQYIARLFGFFEDNGRIILIMEYAAGGDLYGYMQRYKNSRVPHPEAKRIITQVTKALFHAHNKHVYHRDIKAENIMLDSEGVAENIMLDSEGIV